MREPQFLGASSVLSKKRQRSSSSKTSSAMLRGLDVLDCPVCFEALTIPIFQISTTLLDLNILDCPICLEALKIPIFQTVLESILILYRNAKLGCNKKFNYGKESTHEKECMFSPCSCPVRDCNFIASYKDLHIHAFIIHQLKEFRYGVSFSAQMNISDKMLIKREDTKTQLLFVVQCFREPDGVYVTVSCIAPSVPEMAQFSYELSYTTADGYTLTFKSPEVKRVLKVSLQTPRDNFMLIPNTLLRGELLDMKLCIQKLN